MVYIAAQTTALIKNTSQMDVSACTRQYLSDNEGLTFVHELIDYIEPNTWKQITDNMRRPPMIPDPTNAAQMFHQAAFVLSSKPLGCLRISTVAVWLFRMKDSPIFANIMMYD